MGQCDICKKLNIINIKKPVDMRSINVTRKRSMALILMTL